MIALYKMVLANNNEYIQITAKEFKIFLVGIYFKHWETKIPNYSQFERICNWNIQNFNNIKLIPNRRPTLKVLLRIETWNAEIRLIPLENDANTLNVLYIGKHNYSRYTKLWRYIVTFLKESR